MGTTSHRWSGVVGLCLALILASACSSTDGTSDAAASDRSEAGEVEVVQPGRPGEPAQTVDPDDLPSTDAWNEADVAFVQMMIPHHDQALEMSRLAMTRASDEQVLSLARRIRGAQGPEIIALAAWLDERNIDVPKADEDAGEYDHGQHGHSEMAGMLTEQQMTELAAERGAAFDRLFLRRMIGHHEGAVAMAEDVAPQGTDQMVAEMAADVATGQSAEIQRMREILAQL